jgi:BlaI family penicillinase repressor
VAVKKTHRNALELPRPTDAEVEILSVLWERGPSTVREVHEAISENRAQQSDVRLQKQAAKGAVGYTTILKLMQIMTDKGLVRRDETERAHVYEARLPEEQTQRQLVGDLMNRVFAGSASKLVMHALSESNSSAEDLSKIREILDELERGGR